MSYHKITCNNEAAAGAGGGGGGNVSSGSFNAVHDTLMYSAATIGVIMTGKTLQTLFIGGAEYVQQGYVSVNDSGGLTFTSEGNPTTGNARFYYN